MSSTMKTANSLTRTLHPSIDGRKIIHTFLAEGVDDSEGPWTSRINITGPYSYEGIKRAFSQLGVAINQPQFSGSPGGKFRLVGYHPIR